VAACPSWSKNCLIVALCFKCVKSLNISECDVFFTHRKSCELQNNLKRA
jgi:hypothetical protein